MDRITSSLRKGFLAGGVVPLFGGHPCFWSGLRAVDLLNHMDGRALCYHIPLWSGLEPGSELTIAEKG